jgi:hypothetical protein
MNEARHCVDCGVAHYGEVPCGMTYLERLRSVRVDGVMVTRTKREYYDSGPVDEVFGEDSRDRYWSETGGRGAIKRDDQGRLWQKPYKGEWEQVGPEAVFAGAGPEREQTAEDRAAAPDHAERV